MLTRLFLVHALSPLHAGTGQAVGAIDLPIARERPTGVPLLPGSSIKGALRARCTDEPWRKSIFGPDTSNAAEHAGAVQFSDAHLLLMPVRSAMGTFAWVTSPYLLRRLARDAREGGLKLDALEGSLDAGACIVTESSSLPMKVGESSKVVLEDLDFTPRAAGAKSLAGVQKQLGLWLFPDGTPDAGDWRKSLGERLCVVHDDAMSLLLETATEVTARIKLDEHTKTVAPGQLWYEEALPVESVLYGLVSATDVSALPSGRKEGKATDMLDQLGVVARGMVQLGGKSTVGRGACVVRFVGAAS